MKLTREALRGLILEQMGMMGMGGPDPELVARLAPIVRQMESNPEAYHSVLNMVRDDSFYDEMGLDSMLGYVSSIAERIGDTDMVQVVGTIHGDQFETGVETVAQSRQAEQEAQLANLPSMDDPTEMADPYAAEPAEIESMAPLAESSVDLGRWNLLAGTPQKKSK